MMDTQSLDDLEYLFKTIGEFRLSNRGKKYGKTLIEKFWRGDRLDNLQLKNAILILPILAILDKKNYSLELFKELKDEFLKRFDQDILEHIGDNSNLFLLKQGYFEPNPDYDSTWFDIGE